MIRDCTICLVPHDDPVGTHTAMGNVRDWLRQRVTFSEALPVEDKPLRQPIKERAEQSPVRLNRVDRMRSACPKVPKKRTGRGPGKREPYKAGALTPRVILDSLAAGIQMRQMADTHGLNIATLSKRLSGVLKDPVYAAEWKVLTTCGCGASKRPAAEVCAACGKRKARQARKELRRGAQNS